MNSHEFDGSPSWQKLITVSYEREVGVKLCLPVELMDLDAVVLCHDTSADPQFVYANQAAQSLWRRSWREFVGMPSRLTAAEPDRADRSTALAAPGVVRGYSGVRVTSDGRIFRFRDAVVWPVYEYSDVDGGRRRVGQAATFRHWEYSLE